MVDLRHITCFSEASSIRIASASTAQYSATSAPSLYFTLLRVACALLYSSCQAVAVSRRFGKSVVPEPSVNVSRTGTRNRVRSRLEVFPKPKKLNPGFFWGNFPTKRSPVSAQRPNRTVEPSELYFPTSRYARMRARNIEPSRHRRFGGFGGVRIILVFATPRGRRRVGFSSICSFSKLRPNASATACPICRI
jgi:hypothetical protein